MARLFRKFFGVVDAARRVFLNLVFFLLVLLLVLVFTRTDPAPEVEAGMALVLDPVGTLVEEYDVDPFDRALNRVAGNEMPQVRLRELVDAVERAVDDDRIAVLVLDLSRLWPSGLSKLQELRGPLQVFRASGRKVVAYADVYGQSQYYLAAVADEIHTHPMGGVFIDGFGTWRVYMREALDKLMLDWHVYKAGDYKSYMEPYTRDDMSPESREDTRAWLGTLWAIYAEDVERARALDTGTVQRYADGLVSGLQAAEGHLARYSQAAGLVDHLSGHDAFETRMVELVGDDGDDDGFHGIGWREYLHATGSMMATQRIARGKDLVAVLPMRGVITLGDPGLSAVGADRMLQMIREARNDPSVKALVVRVDSPGGSAFASELIRRELERFREDGRPLVVSMSSVAASGGYWIATPADEIWAQPTTITGSIGVISMFPTFPRAMRHLGLNTDGIGTTDMAGALRADREVSEEAAAMIQSLVDGVYSDFIERVVQGRGLQVEVVEEIAQGRVWSGQDAHRLGLVDGLGGVDDAIAAAAARAGIGEYSVEWLERPLEFRERLLLDLLESRLLTPLARAMVRRGDRPLLRVLADIERELPLPYITADPRGVYLYCFCPVEPPFNPRAASARRE